MNAECYCIDLCGWPCVSIYVVYTYLCLCVCLLGIYAQLCYRLDLWEWSCGGLSSLRLPDLATPNQTPLTLLEGTCRVLQLLTFGFGSKWLCLSCAAGRLQNKTHVPCSPRAVGTEKTSLLLLYVPKSFISFPNCFPTH